MNKRISFWVLFTVTFILYLIMSLWSLPYISTLAMGLVPFDFRPSGYSDIEAREFLNALNQTGRDFYINVQHKLDFAYPILLAATLAFSIFLLVPIGWGKLKITLPFFAVPIAIFDLLENFSVAQMLNADIANLSSELIAKASFYTVLKSYSTTIIASFSLVLLLRWFWIRFKSK